MPNVTLSIPEDLLKSGREYALKHKTSLNALIRKLLSKTVQPKAKDELKKFLNLADQAKLSSKGQKKWSRESLYERSR